MSKATAVFGSLVVTNDKFTLTMADDYHDGTSMGLIPVLIGS